MHLSISQMLMATLLLGGLLGCSAMQPVDPPVEVGVASLGEHGIEVDEQRIPSYREVRNELADFELSSDTRPLTAAECACLAASHSRMATLLEKEAGNARRELNLHRWRGPSELLPGILRDQAEQERNKAALQALVAYYQLVEIHLQNAVLADSYGELDRVRKTVTGLVAAGMPVKTDLGELDRRRAELNRRSNELSVNELRLTAQIRMLIGADSAQGGAIQTICEIEPRSVGYELSDAMEIARTNDSQLKSLRKLLHCGSVEDLDAARGLLRVASPMLGQSSSSPGFFAKIRITLSFGHDASAQDELRLRKHQLRELYQARQQQLDLEVANGVVSVQQQYMEVGIAKDILASWDARVSTLASQRELRKSGYDELVAAKSDRLKAKSNLIHKLILLEIEHAKLRATMGLLSKECASGASGIANGKQQSLPLHGPGHERGLQLRN